jgi:ribosomal protein S18 acetylase RimI-like enzyme
MIAPAHAGHLATLRALIREGAAEGGFDRELASDSAETQLFFANLRQALVTGYFVVEDARGVLSRRAVPGYVYWPEDRNDLSQPVGFGLFRAFADLGYELWLTGVASAWRHAGHGRALLRALLATPAGRLAWIVRVQHRSESSAAMSRLLADHGYAPARETETTHYFLRHDAPEALRERIRDGLIAGTASLH